VEGSQREMIKVIAICLVLLAILVLGLFNDEDGGIHP
jgi:hypothetical protein